MSSKSTTTEYRGTSRGARRTFYRWRRILVVSVTIAALLCLAGTGYLLVFTHPSEDRNLAAFYTMTVFGSFFGIWSGGYLIRRLAEPDREHPQDTWPCTRQAGLGTLGLTISYLLLRAGWLNVATILMLAICVLAAEAGLIWISMRDRQ